MEIEITHLEEQLARATDHLARVSEASRTTDNLDELSAAFNAVAAVQRLLAAAKGEEYAALIDIGFVPESAVSEPVLLQTDNMAILTFSAERRREDGRREDAGYAIVELELCSLTKFGHPNDEALPSHPLAERGLDAYGV